MAGIYIHIPFCHSKCAYCDFYSLPLKWENEFIDSLENEYRHRISELKETVNTIYLGGGTPSCLSKKVWKESLNFYHLALRRQQLK